MSSAEAARCYRRNNPLRSLVIQVKARCKRIGREFDLDHRFLELPEYCPVLGLKLEWTGTVTDNTPSLDRIDNSRGYTHDNVQIISNKANRMKTDATPEQLRKFAEWILETYL